MSLALNGCGGGGGKSGTTTTPPVAPNCISTSEGCLTPAQYRNRIDSIKQTHSNHSGFSNQWGLDKIKANAAWAKIQLKNGADTAPGAGITLGAIDSGIDTGHDAFSGKTLTEVFLQGATDEIGSSRSHGTEVASVMVANPSQNFIDETNGARGVAWGADITMLAVPTSPGVGNYVPISLVGLNYLNHPTRWPAIINSATGWTNGGRSLDFVNVSLGFRGLIDMYSASDLTANFNNVINAIKQSGSNRTVFVWAAGNAHGKSCDATDFPTDYQHLCNSGTVNAVSPGILAGLPARIPALRTNHIAVVAIKSDGLITDFSNRCGIASDWCIAAPGQAIQLAIFGPIDGQNGQRGSLASSGTSYAAPHVTGGLAVMKHFFRSQLSNVALVTRLYATANKSGIYSDKSIYGQGLMDLDAAVSPIGFTYVVSGNQVDDGGEALDDTALNLGTAFGDGLTQSLANQEIVAFDELGAPFWYSLDRLIDTRTNPSIESRLKKFMNRTDNNREFGMFQPVLGALSTESSNQHSERLSLGLMDTSDIVNDGGHLSLLGQAIAINRPGVGQFDFSLFSNELKGDQATVAGMEFVSRPFKKPVVFRSGVVSERQSLLRSSATGAFGRISSNTVFAGLEGNLQVGSWHLSAGAEIGTVVTEVEDSLLSIKSPLTTSAFAMRAGKKLDERDTVTFVLSQPVRIESGRAEYTIPIGRTTEGDVLKSVNSVDLEPSGRQIDLVAQWRRSFLTSSGDFRLATGLSFHPEHRATVEPELSVLAGWRKRF